MTMGMTNQKLEENYESYPPYNFSWFIEGKIAAMACPHDIANLNYLADEGVNHLVTLSPETRPPMEDCKRLGWTEMSIEDFGTPTLRQMKKFIEICERADSRGERIGVHCRHGRGRTGTMLACYLVHFRDMAPEHAVHTVRDHRPGSCETEEQENFVSYYHDYVQRKETARQLVEEPNLCTDDSDHENGDEIGYMYRKRGYI